MEKRLLPANFKSSWLRSSFAIFFCILWSINVFAQTISVDKSVKYQTIEGFGGFGPKKVWWDAGPYHDAEYLNQTVDNLGVTLFRTQIYWDGEPTNDNSDPNSIDFTKFNFGPTSDNGKQFPFIKDLAAKGAKIIASVWTPPIWMKLLDDPNRIPAECYNCYQCPAGSPGRAMCGGRLNPSYYSEFAEYLVAYVKTVKQQTGVDIYALSIQNEPFFANPFEANVMYANEYADVLKIVGQRFDAEGLPTKFFGPEHMAEWSWGVQQNYVTEILGDATVKPHLDIYAVHGYVDGVAADYGNAEGWTTLYNNITAAHGKPLWMTETSDGSKSGYDLAFNMARSLYLALKFGRITAWVYWYMADVAIVNNQLTPLGYAFKNFYRYIRPGAVSVNASSTDAQILTLAFDNPLDNTTTIILINNGTTSKQATLQISGSSPSSLTIYRTSATENTANIGTVSSTGQVQLPAQSITTLHGINGGTTGGNGTGLKGEYFNNKTLAGTAALNRTDETVNFDWASGSPVAGTIPVDNFSVRWTGKVEAPVTGSYTFSTVSDDGVRLWVNGAQVINNWTDHAPTTNNSSSITLTAGQKYDIRMEYFESGGGAVAKLLWTYPGQAQQAIPKGRLYPTPLTDAVIVFLSDLAWTSATNGHGPVEKDKSNGETAAGDGKTITLNGTTYTKGLGAHAASTITYNLGGNYSSFSSDIGLDDEVGSNGSVVFQVLLDGVEAYNSGTMNGSTATKSINLNVSGKNELKLLITNAGDGNAYDHADWAGARLTSGNSSARESFEIASTQEEFNIYPNPSNSSTLHINIYSDREQEAKVDLMNVASPQSLAHVRKNLSKGINHIEVPVSHLKNGAYLLIVNKGVQRIVRKVLIAK